MPSVALAERIYALADKGWGTWVISVRVNATPEVVERTLHRRPKSAGSNGRSTKLARTEVGPGAALTAPAPAQRTMEVR